MVVVLSLEEVARMLEEAVNDYETHAARAGVSADSCTYRKYLWVQRMLVFDRLGIHDVEHPLWPLAPKGISTRDLICAIKGAWSIRNRAPFDARFIKRAKRGQYGPLTSL